MSLRRYFVLLVLSIRFSAQAGPPRPIEADLLIVGANESGCAAAVQAARLGVKKIVLTNDIQWLGGQFSAEAVGVVDEWTTVQGKRTHFPRSGLFAEVLQRMRAVNSRKYGLPNPANAVCGTETIEPAEAEQIFEKLIAEYPDQIRLLRPWQPVSVAVAKSAGGDKGHPRVTGVTFEDPSHPEKSKLTVHARLTMDCSDWGDVIRLSGAAYAAGVDLKSRFNEPSAPETAEGPAANEMNPISYCLVLREATPPGVPPLSNIPITSPLFKIQKSPSAPLPLRPSAAKTQTPQSLSSPQTSPSVSAPPPPIPAPLTYNPRSFAALDTTIPFIDSAYPEGIYSITNQSIYTHRRLVDRWHNHLAPGAEAVLLNWPVQDYPLYDFPQNVADALEATEPGASQKNIVNMTYAQRQIVFNDAKQHSLGLLHHLQTAVTDRVGDYPQSFRRMHLTDEFGTSDKLPPKPYIREGLRLEALYMLREQDIRAKDRQPRWAAVMAPDGVFGFQFNIDFHPTRRNFLDNGDPAGPWQFIHTKNRGWHTDTDRALLPLRCLVPVEYDGLLGGSKNIGVTSVVQSALRLHGHMMHVGQATATLAYIALRDDVQPRAIAADWKDIREIQQRLLRGAGGPGLLLWPWENLSPGDSYFEAANLLTLLGIWKAAPDTLDFQPNQIVTRRELAAALARLLRSTPKSKPWPNLPDSPAYSDLPLDDPDRPLIESLITWGTFGTQKPAFQPEDPTTWGTFHRWLSALNIPPNKVLSQRQNEPLTHAECVRFLYQLLQDLGETLPTDSAYLQPANDSDHDQIPDLNDPLPFDKDNDGQPDPLDPKN